MRTLPALSIQCLKETHKAVSLNAFAAVTNSGPEWSPSGLNTLWMLPG